MGIGVVPQQLLRDLALPAGFSVCELGDQMYATVPKRGMLKSWERAPAEKFYRNLGCGQYVSIDANGKARLLADLNVPVEDIGQFDLVTDFGTSEHVFDVAQTWKTKHQLVKVGGYIAGEQPFVGYEDHGFYSYHPTLIKDIAAANDYRIQHFSTPSMGRGLLVRYILQRAKSGGFEVPTQGKYAAKLKI